MMNASLRYEESVGKCSKFHMHHLLLFKTVFDGFQRAGNR